MVDIDAAIGYVVARGDAVDRARLSFLRTGVTAPDEVFVNVELGQTSSGGWPAQWAGNVASIDATCFRLAEFDDLDGLRRPAAVRALDWLASQQRIDGSWEEDSSLAESAPAWARPGDAEARFYLTANAAFWLAVASADAVAAAEAAARSAVTDSIDLDALASSVPAEPPYAQALSRAARAILDSLNDDGGWPGFLVSGWLAGAVLHRAEWFYEAARIFVILNERVKTMSATDAAWMVAALRRVGVSPDDSLLVAGRQRLDETQRPDGSWPSDDAPAFDVHTTLTALRAIR